jgi:hypothetical protein
VKIDSVRRVFREFLVINHHQPRHPPQAPRSRDERGRVEDPNREGVMPQGKGTLKLSEFREVSPTPSIIRYLPHWPIMWKWETGRRMFPSHQGWCRSLLVQWISWKERGYLSLSFASLSLTFVLGWVKRWKYSCRSPPSSLLSRACKVQVADAPNHDY